MLTVDLIVTSGQRARRSGRWRRVGPLRTQEEEFRDYWAEGLVQLREPYQNADRMADLLVRSEFGVAPAYTPPPEYKDPPEYYILPDYVDSD